MDLSRRDALPNRPTFSGNPSEDVTIFIQSVQMVAFEQGRQRDDDWRTDYLTTCLSGDALLFYSELDDEDQYSWRRLRAALLQRFARSLAPEPPAAAMGPQLRSCLGQVQGKWMSFVIVCDRRNIAHSLPGKGSVKVIFASSTTPQARLVAIFLGDSRGGVVWVPSRRPSRTLSW